MKAQSGKALKTKYAPQPAPKPDLFSETLEQFKARVAAEPPSTDPMSGNALSKQYKAEAHETPEQRMLRKRQEYMEETGATKDANIPAGLDGVTTLEEADAKAAPAKPVAGMLRPSREGEESLAKKILEEMRKLGFE